MDQDSLNTEMVREGRLRYWKNVNKAKQRGHESCTPHGRRMIEGILGPFVEGIKTWIRSESHKKAGRNNSLLPIMKEFDPALLAMITAKVCIDCCGHKRAQTYTINKIGAGIEDEMRFLYLKKKHRGLWNKLKTQIDESTVYHRKRAIVVLAMNRSEEIEFQPLDRNTKVRLGVTLADIFMNTTGILESVNIPSRNGKPKHYLSFKPGTVAWIQKFNEYAEAGSVMWLPTVQKPISWNGPFLGGYDLECIEGCTMIKTKDHVYLKDLEANYPMPRVYEAVNSLQNTPWRVNNYVFDVANQMIKSEVDRAALPPLVDRDMPRKPEDIEINKESRKKWKMQCRSIIKENIQHRAKRTRVFSTIALARKFHRQPNLYFPYQADFRGRLYCQASYLNPQSDDLGKSLLEFAEGKPMKNERDERWLAIHGANLFGYDKVSMHERYDWVLEHNDLIIKNAEDPYSNNWWEEADKPWQFLAFCNEWARYKKIGIGFMTHLPTQVDGTNNGLQMLSLLMRDEVGAFNTNCANNETPVDAYQMVADEVIKQLDLDIAKGNEDAKYWKEFGITRKTTKRSVMILPYGGTSYSSMAYVEDWYKEQCMLRKIHMTDQVLSNKRTMYLAGLVWKAVGSSVGRALEAMSWMSKCVKELCKEGVPIEWVTPAGLKVKQAYKSDKDVYVNTVLGDKIKKTRLKEESKNLDLKRQVNGISPNFVHSLDAAVLQKTICLANQAGLSSYSMIHDSFGTHCTDMDVLSAAVRVTIHRIFSEDWLNKLREDFQKCGGDDVVLPELPEFGTFDVSEVLDSEYLFS